MFASSHRAAFALAAGMALAGCGGHTFTKADYVARADAICASTLRTLRAAGPSSSLATYLVTAVPALQSQARQLRALPAPAQSAANRALLTRYLAALDGDVRSVQALARATRAGDAQGATDAEAALQTSSTTTLAARYGLANCAAPTATVT